MKWNLLSRWKQHRQQKKTQKQQRKLLQTWSWLEQVFQSGMLSFDNKAHRLFITQPFASLLMTNGADGWINSIHAIYQYTYLRLSQQAWDEYMQKEEMKAVREALSKNPKLQRSDIDRIRWSRRQEIGLNDMEPPKVEPFEFFIIPLTTEAKVEPLAVGYYDPNTAQMDVAMWDDVAQLLKAARE